MSPCSVVRTSQPSLGWHRLRVRQRVHAAGSGVSPEDRYSKNTETGVTSTPAEAFQVHVCLPSLEVETEGRRELPCHGAGSCAVWRGEEDKTNPRLCSLPLPPGAFSFCLPARISLLQERHLIAPLTGSMS